MHTSDTVRLVADAYEQFVLSLNTSIDLEDINNIVQNHLEVSLKELEVKVMIKEKLI